jgi:hypothetical protein
MSVSTNQIDLAADLASPQRGQQFNLPPTTQLLTSGGDARIICDAVHGFNKYGCSAAPEPEILAYGSSTASTITLGGFGSAERLRLRLLRAARLESPPTTYAREIARIRTELLDLCGLSDLPGVEAIFGVSGTDIHLIAGQLASDVTTSDLLAVMIDPAETGSGVPAALAGQHFSDYSALGGVVTPGVNIFGGGMMEIAAVAVRRLDGVPRAARVVDAEVEKLVVNAVAAGRRVLLDLVDVSKTGMIAPSLACALDLRRRFPAAVNVLVDACQFRLAPSTIRAYLEHGFWVALTGSKFVGGPAFSGVLLLPNDAARRLRTGILSPALSAYSARADWPSGWIVRHALRDVENYGLLLRWEAALTELHRFRSLSESAIAGFLETFQARIQHRLTTDSIFKLLPVPKIDRRALSQDSSWDNTPTIFPFILCRAANSGEHSVPLTRLETARVHTMLGRGIDSIPGLYLRPKERLLAMRRCQLGQPVQCGTFHGVSVSALRLCASIRLIVDAISPEGRGVEVVIAEALLTLDKCAFLTSAIDQIESI